MEVMHGNFNNKLLINWTFLGLEYSTFLPFYDAITFPTFVSTTVIVLSFVAYCKAGTTPSRFDLDQSDQT
ncbi:MAG: hypothetical protein AAF519_17025 [Bacteroidota bacterium]